MVLRLLSLAILVVATPLAAQDPVPRKSAPLALKPVKKLQGPAGWLGFRHTAGRDSLVVLEVAPGSPAEHAGLRTGDWITMVGNRVATRQLLLDNPPMVGESRQLTVRRDGETLTLEIIAVAPPPGTLMPTRAMAAVADTVAAEARLLRTEMASRSTRALMVPRADSQMYLDLKFSGTVSPEYAEVFRALAEMKRDTGQGLRTEKQIDPEWYRELERTMKGTDELLVKLKSQTNALAGAELEELNPGLADYFGGVAEGVFVLRVAAGTPAGNAGLLPGDIVETLNGERVQTIRALRAGIAEASGPLTLHVIRKGRPATIMLRKE